MDHTLRTIVLPAQFPMKSLALCLNTLLLGYFTSATPVFLTLNTSHLSQVKVYALMVLSAQIHSFLDHFLRKAFLTTLAKGTLYHSPSTPLSYFTVLSLVLISI